MSEGSIIVAFELWWDRGSDPDEDIDEDKKAAAYYAYRAGYAQAEADAKALHCPDICKDGPCCSYPDTQQDERTVAPPSCQAETQ